MKKERKSENALTSPASKVPKVSALSEVKVKTPKPLMKTSKSNIETPKPDKTTKVDKTPKVNKPTKIDKAAKAEKTPKPDKGPKAESMPIVKTPGKANVSPKVEKTPKALKVNKAPVVESAPENNQTPKAEKAAKAEKTPKPNKTPKPAKTPTVPKSPKSELKKEKSSKTPEQQNGTPAPKTVEAPPKDVVVPEKSTLDKKQVAAFVDALYKLHEKKIVKAGTKVSKDKLFDDDETERINLLISSIKLPSDKRHQILSIELPHGILPEPTEVCLIVKDLQKGLKVDHEPTTIHFRDILNEKGIGPDFISTVMPLRELKVEYKAYETKTALCHKFDAFLADDCIMRLLPQFLGKAFYKRKKFPRGVNLKANDLKAEFTKALRTTTLPLSHHGPSAMVQIGHVGMAKEHITQNLMKVTEVLEKRFPGGWKNIRSIHIKTEKSLAIPMYLSEVPVNAIGYVDASLPKKKAMEEVTDELSTRPGLEVTVHKSGKLRIKKKPDPNWDASRDECLSEASDDEEEEDSDDESAKKKPVAKKEKKEAKKRPNKETTAEAERNGKKKKQKKAKVEADDKDSEDEEMDRAEQKYLKRQAEEEEADPKDKVEKKSKKDEEIEDDDDVEGSSGEESESFDDDQEIDAKDVILDSNDEGEDEDSDEDAELVLKNKPQHFDEDSDAEKTAKPKHFKKTKKMRRMEIKKQKAESAGGSAQKSKGPHKKRGGKK